jgi:hypothetical protein
MVVLLADRLLRFIERQKQSLIIFKMRRVYFDFHFFILLFVSGLNHPNKIT